MVHDVFDLDYWEELFLRQAIHRLSEEELRQLRLDMTSPFHLVINERLRERAGIAAHSQQAIATDIFIFAEGEPLRREVTKVGGLPYLPIGRPWPKAKSGQFLTFIAQFCFADSQDIIGSLPGGVLLIFVESDESGPTYVPTVELLHQISFEWVSIGDLPLVTAEMIHETAWQPFPCYGVIYQTYDYPDLDASAYPDVAKNIPTINSATKIGGIPAWIQNAEDLPGRFLCELNSTLPEQIMAYPFIEPTPLNEAWQKQQRMKSRSLDFLQWGDIGTLYLFLDSEEQIHWTIQST